MFWILNVFDMQVLASVPNQCYYMAKGEDAAKVSRLVNDGIAKWVEENQNRFCWF